MIKMHHILILFVSLITISPINGQNEVDNQGNKTGPWLVKYPDGKTQYEGTFKAGKPIGLMTRYYKNGDVSAKMEFDSEGERCFGKIYYKMNKLAAEGWYIGQRKDSVWTYYSEYDEHIIMREPYIDGKLHGIVESYYVSGKVAEQTTWLDNEKNGSWKIFFEDGGLRSSGNHTNGLREGQYTTYYSDSTLELSGTYRNNFADGDWILNNEDGTHKFTFKYKAGKLLNESELLESDDELLRKIQDLPDPKEMIEL